MISKKKLDPDKGQWSVRKGMLGWMGDGATRCIKLARDKKSVIDAEQHKILLMTKMCSIQTNQKMDWKQLTCSNISPNMKCFDDAN